MKLFRGHDGLRLRLGCSRHRCRLCGLSWLGRCLRALVIGVAELQRVERCRPFVPRNKVEHVGATVRDDRHVGAAARRQRFKEEKTGAVVGGDLPGVGIADRDILDPLVVAELNRRLDARLADDLDDMVGIIGQRADTVVGGRFCSRAAQNRQRGKTNLADHRSISREVELATPPTRWWR